MTPEEKKAYGEAVRRAKETTTPLVEQKALPDKMPKREDLR